MTTREFNVNNSIEFLVQSARGLSAYKVIAHFAADELHMKEDEVKAFMDGIKQNNWSAVSDLQTFYLWYYINYILPIKKKYNINVAVPDVGSFEGTKIHPVKIVEVLGLPEIIDPCDPDEAQFFSVYLKDLQGPAVCVADCATEQAAENLECFIEFIVRHLHVRR